jgi:hypothetical protein
MTDKSIWFTVALIGLICAIFYGGLVYAVDSGPPPLVPLNWPTVVNTFFATLPATIAAIGAVWVGVRNSRKITKVVEATNGLAAKIAAAKLAEGHAIGKAAGVEQERAATREREAKE